jgi:hypothetical protein
VAVGAEAGERAAVGEPRGVTGEAGSWVRAGDQGAWACGDPEGDSGAYEVGVAWDPVGSGGARDPRLIPFGRVCHTGSSVAGLEGAGSAVGG